MSRASTCSATSKRWQGGIPRKRGPLKSSHPVPRRFSRFFCAQGRLFRVVVPHLIAFGLGKTPLLTVCMGKWPGSRRMGKCLHPAPKLLSDILGTQSFLVTAAAAGVCLRSTPVGLAFMAFVRFQAFHPPASHARAFIAIVRFSSISSTCLIRSLVPLLSWERLWGVRVFSEAVLRLRISSGGLAFVFRR